MYMYINIQWLINIGISWNVAIVNYISYINCYHYTSDGNVLF